jgi:hypothetical protein
MFMLYAVVVGLAAGLALRGKPGRLAEFQFKWWPLAMGGLLVQLALFSPAFAEIGALGPLVYVVSTVIVAIAVLRNVRTHPGFALVGLGAAANVTAIIANGGYMPVMPEALAASGRTITPGFSNSMPSSRPLLEALVDRFVMPPGLPFANVFSVGDVLIAIGIAVVIVVAMRPARDTVGGEVR